MMYESETLSLGERCEYWKNDNGEYHREDGPAVVNYDENGQLLHQQWCINGKWHRETGPAVIDYHEDGNMYYKVYFWNDYQITDFVEKIFGEIPNELTKDQAVLLKLSLPEEYFSNK